MFFFSVVKFKTTVLVATSLNQPCNSKVKKFRIRKTY